VVIPRILVAAFVAIAQGAVVDSPHGDRYNKALGVECTHCHVEGNWRDDSKAAFGTAGNMSRMVAALNRDQLREIGEISCWTCHGGQVKPARQPRAPFDAELAKWPADLASSPDSLKFAMAVYDVALGVSCDHCHVADWKQPEKKAMRTVSAMKAMFEEFPKYMPETARTQCYMCHKGSTKPRRVPDRF
jgi:photosynthetic reaction center cytochrome c subunit